MTKMFFLLQLLALHLLFFFLTTMVHKSKFTPDHIQKLLGKYMCLSFIKLSCTIHNKIQKLESNLLKPYLKQSSYFAHAVNNIWFQAVVTLKAFLVGTSGTTWKTNDSLQWKPYYSAKEGKDANSCHGDNHPYVFRSIKVI